MALIRVDCAACGASLQVRAELGGQQGRCPKCGAAIAIPAAITEAAPVGLSLAQATAPDFMLEMARRKRSAVLVVFETPPDRSYELSRQAAANVRCYRTADMTDAQLMQVLEQVGHMSKGQRNQKGGIGLQPDGQPLPFELKGDRLGTTLDEFKAKYTRQIGSIKLPYCSDSCPGQVNQELRSEPWHTGAGIVHGRVDLPSESNPPTLAGVRTELLLYQFVEGKLFRITAVFDTEQFHLIHDALVRKQGPPTREVKEPQELVWDNGVSMIKLFRGTMRPKRSSTVHYVHTQLYKIVETRTPKRSDDL
jgi:hypothetical protein